MHAIKIDGRGAKWTAEQREEIASLWRSGLSAGMISKRVGGTRNAIIGVIHRLGLCRTRATTHRIYKRRAIKQKRPTPPMPRVERRPPAQFNNRSASKAEKAVAVNDYRAALASMAAAPDVIRIHSVLDLDRHDCRWPIGEPTKGYCGCRAVPGLPYCAGHARRAYRIDALPRATAEIILKESVAA